MVSICLRGVTKRFADTIAVDNVDLTIQEGELFFLLGPSGCGKTTILRIIAGFYSPDEGGILFDDRDISAVPPHKRNTGMVFSKLRFVAPYDSLQECRVRAQYEGCVQGE